MDWGGGCGGEGVWGGERGSSSSASPSAFIVNNLLSVCDAAVLRLPPLSAFLVPHSDGLCKEQEVQEAEGECEKGGRPGALRRGGSDAEVFL